MRVASLDLELELDALVACIPIIPIERDAFACLCVWDTCSNAFVVGCAPFLLGFPGKSKIVQKFKHIGLDYFSRVYRNKEGA